MKIIKTFSLLLLIFNLLFSSIFVNSLNLNSIIFISSNITISIFLLYFIYKDNKNRKKLKAYSIKIAQKGSLERIIKFLNINFKETPFCFYIKDLSLHYKMVNDKYSKVCGFDKKDIIDQTDFLIFDKKFAEDNNNQDLEVLKTKKPLKNILRKLYINGVKNYILINKYPLFNPENKIIGVFNINFEITKYKQNEKELIENKNILELILNSVPSQIYWKDKEMRYLGCNKMFANFSNISNTEDIVGKKDENLIFDPNTIKYSSDRDKDILKGEKIVSKIEELKNYKGEQKFFELTKVGLKDFNNNIYGFLAVYNDITKLKQAELKLKKIAKERFISLANMSHEIRTPINGIIGVLDLLKSTKLNKEQNEYLDIALNSSKILLSIINDILDISKIDSGQFDIDSIDFDIYNFIEELSKFFNFKIEQKKLKFNLDIDKNIPQYLKGDPNRVRQILINLINNGIKFTSKGFISLKLKLIKVEKGDIFVKFSVKDSGIGIESEIQNKLFSIFTQAGIETTKKYGGTGLGLSISKKLTNLMGGDIGVRSEKGEGATFFFTIKFKKGDKVKIKKDSFEVDKIDKNISILVAEDNLINQKVIKAILYKLGYEIDIAKDGKIAVDMVKNGNYDLIFMDIQMPVMDGFEATKEINLLNLKKKPKIVAMSANAIHEIKNEALLNGFDNYLTKPVRPNEIKHFLNNLFK